MVSALLVVRKISQQQVIHNCGFTLSGRGEIVTDGLHFAKPLQVIRHGVQVIRHDRPVICG